MSLTLQHGRPENMTSNPSTNSIGSKSPSIRLGSDPGLSHPILNEALYKAFLGAGINLPKHKNMIITVKDEDKEEVIPIARRFEALGYKIYATRSTAKVLQENGVHAVRTNKIEQPSPNLMDLILGHKIDLVIDTPSQGVEKAKDGFIIRRNAIETGVNVLTSLDTAEALVTSLENTDIQKLELIDIATVK